MAREFGVATAQLRLSIALGGPIALGIVRPLVYLPVSAVTGLTPVQIDAVLAHELAHLRRADFAWNLVQTIVEALYFFHPAVWWLNREIRIQREWCCDDEATAWCGAPMVYADALHRLASRQQTRRAGLVMALGGQPGLMLDRISRILGAPTARRQPSGRRLSIAVTSLCAAALLGLSAGNTADTKSRGATPRPFSILQPASSHPATSVPESASRPRPIAIAHFASTSMQASLPASDDKTPPAPIAAQAQSIDIERPVSSERRLADLRDAQRNEARMTPEFMAAQRARDTWITRNDPPPELHPPDG